MGQCSIEIWGVGSSRLGGPFVPWWREACVCEILSDIGSCERATIRHPSEDSCEWASAVQYRSFALDMPEMASDSGQT